MRHTHPTILAAFLVLTPAALMAQGPPVEGLILSPDPGANVPAGETLVAVSFIDPDGRLGPAAVQLRVDGRDVTPEADLSGGVLTWRPPAPLPTGPHRVEVRTRPGAATPVQTLRWTFSVGPAERPVAAGQAADLTGGTPGWLRAHGSLVLDGVAQTVDGPGAPLRREEDFLPRMWLNAGGYLRPGWRYTTQVHMSGYETADAQPVNRYRVALRTPQLDAAVGDVNPILHDLILAGRRVRGVQADLRAGPARLTVVRGQSRRAVPGQLAPDDPSAVARTGTFEQDLLAIRPALGSGHRFQAGVTVLRVRDDVGSVPDLRTSPVSDGASTRSVNPPPKDNLVVGADVLLRLFSGRVMLEYENGLSLLANDISGGALTEAGLDSIMEDAGQDPLGIDPTRYDHIFTLNASLIPLDPRGLSSLAQQVRGSVRAGSHMVSLEWRSIGGSYYTLGYPALQRDRRGVRVRDTFTLLDDALAIFVGYEQDEDNLEGLRAATTTSRGTFGSISWQPSVLAPGFSASVRLGSRVNDLAAGEDGAVDERNRILTLGATYPVGLFESLRTRLVANVSLVDREDSANPSVDLTERYYLGGIQVETPSRSSEASLMVGLNRTDAKGLEAGETDYRRVVAHGRHQLSARWSALLDGTYAGATSPADAGELGLDYDRAEVLAGGEFAWTPLALLTLMGGVAEYADGRDPERDTRELLLRVRMSRSF